MTYDLEHLKSLVVEAGTRALVKWGDVGHEFKADQSLVTDVDRETELFLRTELCGKYPATAFLGEEFGWQGARDVPLWACDPIDGTTNFVFGLPHWCVSVGLIEDGVPTLGALYLPVTRELFWARNGEGAFCNGTPLASTDRDELHVEDTICCTSNAAKSLNIEAIPGRIRSLGSIAAELAYTARGSLCATLGLREGIVDIAAALCIAFEAGCEFRYLRGPKVDIADLLGARTTEEHFVYAPPRLGEYLRERLRVVRGV